MRRILILSFVLALMAFSLFASNDQKIWSVDSNEYRMIEYLYILDGHALPSVSGPWNTEEMKLMLEKVENLQNTEAYRLVHDALYEEDGFVIEDGLRLGVGVEANLYGYLHNNEDFVYGHTYEEGEETKTVYLHPGSQSFSFDEMDKKPELLVELDGYVGDNIYGYFGYTFEKYRYHLARENSSKFATNDVLSDTAKMSMLWPNRGFLSFGGEHWNVELGRDRLKWGYGVSGSLLLSDNFPFHNLIRFTVPYRNFKFAFLLSFFEHQKDYDNKTGKGDTSQSGTLMQLSHRLETRFLSDRLSLAITESLLYQSEDNTLDIRVVNPIGFYHNLYNDKNSNSILVVDLSFSPVKGVSLYGSFLCDDLQTSTEGAKHPNALGYMVGGKFASPMGTGILYGSLEGVYTDPYTYLRSVDGEDGTSSSAYNMNFVGAIKDSIYHYAEYFIGYTYGNDLMALNANMGWENLKGLRVEGNVFYMLHGEKNINSLYKTYDAERTPHGETWYLFDLGAFVSYQFGKGFSVYGQYDYVQTSEASDNQLVLGVSYKPL